MLQDPISKPPDHMSMDVSARGAGAADHRRNKPNSANSEQVLKCPRCDSLNTKFCYYNNYSLTQPRHFCKNCRRYWTQGGSLRNVPIGGGCRKNKRVKQRTVDPHLFGGLVGGEDQYSGPGSFLMQHAAGTAAASGVPSSLLSGSLFNVGGAPVSSCVPGSFSDLAPGNDSYLLSMAFSRLHEESLRLSSTPDRQLQANKPLSFLHSANPLYDTPALACNNYVKPEHLHAFNGSDHQLAAGLFNEHPGVSSAPILSSSADGLASLDHDQISNFGVAASHVQGACSSGQLDAHLRLQQQRAAQALALHLGGSGAASDQHPMRMNPASCSRTVGLSSVVLDESSSRSLNPERYLDFHHRHHSALPGFEDQESPDQSMSSIMMRRGGQANCKLFPTEGMDNMADERSQLVAVSEGWAQQVTGTDHHQTHANGPCATDAYHDQPVTSGPSAGDQQAHISFWSPSPWSASSTHEDMHAGGAGLL